MYWSSRMSRRQALQLGLGLTAAGLLQACTPFGASTPARQRKTTLKIGASAAVANLDKDPRGFLSRGDNTAAVNLYDSLVGFATKPAALGSSVMDPSRPVGKLAESWTVSPDGKTYTFKLRKGVMSQYGNELTSADVVWTHNRDVTANLNAEVDNKIVGLPAGGVQAIDNYTVQYTLSQPSLIFIPVWYAILLAIYDSTEAQKHVTADDPAALTWLAKNACGFGPYKVTDWVPGQSITFQARSDYYGPKPKNQSIIYLNIPDSANRLAQLERGDLDLTEDPTLDEASHAKATQGLQLVSLPANKLVRLQFNHQTAPFNNVLVRQAVAYAIPYNSIIKDVYKGFAIQSKSVIPESIPGSDDSSWNYATDASKATSLLRQAGVSTPVTLPLMIGPSPEAEQVALAIRTALAPVGFNVVVDKTTAGVYASRVPKSDFTVFLNDTSRAAVLDAGYAFGIWFRTGVPANFGHYSNPQIDALITQATGETDPARRLSILQQAQRVALQDVAAVPIALLNQNVPMRAGMSGYLLAPDLLTRFATLQG